MFHFQYGLVSIPPRYSKICQWIKLVVTLSIVSIPPRYSKINDYIKINISIIFPFQSLLGILKSQYMMDCDIRSICVSIPPRYSKIMMKGIHKWKCTNVSIPPRYSKIRRTKHHSRIVHTVSIPPRYSKIIKDKTREAFMEWLFQSLLGILKSTSGVSIGLGSSLFQSLLGILKSLYQNNIWIQTSPVSIPPRYSKIY